MKHFIILALLLVVCTSIVFLGSFITADKTKYHNSFVRVFPSHVIEQISAVGLHTNTYSVAGLSNTQIFLRDRKKGGVLVLDLASTDTTRVDLNIPKESEIAIDSPSFFIKNGNLGSLQRGNIDTWHIDTTFNLHSGFTALEPISENTFALQTIDFEKRKSVFVKSDSPLKIKDILQTQVDGILCTDGYLQYSKEYSRLIYLYRYRNQLLYLDTAFNIRFVGKTIDTTSVAKISVAEINGEIKMAKPPLVVNKGFCVERRYLFVFSNLVARNESTDVSKRNNVIDIYNIPDGSYLFSFYIPHQDGSRMHSFRVNKNVLIATFQDHIAMYSLSQDYFQF